jgi:hypothetical protein
VALKVSLQLLTIKIVDTLNPSAVKCVRSEINILSEMAAHQNVIGYQHVRILLTTPIG